METPAASAMHTNDQQIEFVYMALIFPAQQIPIYMYKKSWARSHDVIDLDVIWKGLVCNVSLTWSKIICYKMLYVHSLPVLQPYPTLIFVI